MTRIVWISKTKFYCKQRSVHKKTINPGKGIRNMRQEARSKKQARFKTQESCDCDYDAGTWSVKIDELATRQDTKREYMQDWLGVIRRVGDTIRDQVHTDEEGQGRQEPGTETEVSAHKIKQEEKSWNMREKIKYLTASETWHYQFFLFHQKPDSSLFYELWWIVCLLIER